MYIFIETGPSRLKIWRKKLLQLYNTLSRQIDEFKPRENKEVKIFTCGPSIYQRAHLGNYRTFLYEDLLVRYLLFKGFNVERAMNLTDIEDKTISEAKRMETDIRSLTNDVLAIFRESLDGFDFIMPEHLIAATESIEQSVKLIEFLVKSGQAYEHNGDYYFDPLKSDDFGKLFKLDMSRWPKTRRRFKKDTYNGNRWNLGDFILWHNHKNDSEHPYWDTAIGRGRPSWNIQDPAIITMSLGDQVDINCGGIDNIYRHHDYNIALMESFTGKNYANYYMHGEHLIVNGISMSKSRGNIIYPEKLVKEGHDWKDIRFFLTYRHYRSKLNYTPEYFRKTTEKLHSFRSDMNEIKTDSKTSFDQPEILTLIETIIPRFEAHLDNDLSLGKGFDAVHKIIRDLKNYSIKTPLTCESVKIINIKLQKIDNVLNVLYPKEKS
jgi:cysteinyl-tRNA synthetase